jgi:lipopolysaccharide exporter
VLVAALGALGGPLWACLGSGTTYALALVASAVLTARYEGISAWAYLSGVARPLLACVPMFAAVQLLRISLGGGSMSGVALLAAEVALGVAVYVPSAFLLAAPATRDLLDVTRQALRRPGGSPATK